jgi:Leucine-rich repeat (LRR) protein
VRRWIAEGYSRDTSRSTAEENGQILSSKLTSNSTAEENGERIFSKLVELSIIQQQESKVLCQVNGFFHEYIISRPMEDNLVFALDGHCSLNTQHAGQHLTIRSSWDRDEIVFRGIDFSRLRSLTVFGDWKSFMVCDKMSLVRVLDLEDTSGVTNDGVEHIVKLLPRLKFLSLRGCKEISRLPDSLGSLRQLQTLDVRKTSIVRLPLAISKLQKMQYIRAGTSDGTVASLPTTDLHQISTPLEGSDNTILAERDQVQTSTTPSRPRNLLSWLSKLHRPCRLDDNVGVEVPAGIGNNASLHTLGVFNVNVAGGKAFLKELKKLTQLRKLGVCGINGENWKELCSAISDHAHLESLSVQLEKHNQGFLLDDTSVLPPNTLKSLKLYGNVHVLPAWIRQFKNLKKGDLELTISTQQHNDDDLELLPRRSSIRRLCVRPVVHGVLRVGKSILSVLSHQRFRFPVLEIDCTSSLHVHVQLGEYLLESTELLIVHCSIGSSLQISGLGNLEKLQQVWLHGSYGEQLKQELEHQISEHKNNPVLKL